MEREAAEMFDRPRVMPVASKKTKGIKMGGWLCAEGMHLRTSTSTYMSKSVFNKYEFEYTVNTGFTLEVTLRESGVEGGYVKTGFTPEVTLRKSRVECGWDLASPYMVCPCLHAQWSHFSGLVGGGDKDLSQGVNKPVGVELSRLSE